MKKRIKGIFRPGAARLLGLWCYGTKSPVSMGSGCPQRGSALRETQGSGRWDQEAASLHGRNADADRQMFGDREVDTCANAGKRSCA